MASMLSVKVNSLLVCCLYEGSQSMDGMLSVWVKSIQGLYVVCGSQLMASMLSVKVNSWQICCLEVNPWLACYLYEGSQSMVGMLSVCEKSIHGWYVVCM